MGWYPESAPSGQLYRGSIECVGREAHGDPTDQGRNGPKRGETDCIGEHPSLGRRDEYSESKAMPRRHGNDMGSHPRPKRDGNKERNDTPTRRTDLE